MKKDRDGAALVAERGPDTERQMASHSSTEQDERRFFAEALPLDQFFSTGREKTFASLGRVSANVEDNFPWKLDPQKRELIQELAKSNGQASPETSARVTSSDILDFAAEGAKRSTANIDAANSLWWKMRETSPIWRTDTPSEKSSFIGRFFESKARKTADRIIAGLGFSANENSHLFKTEGFSRRTVYTRDYAAIPKQLRALFKMVPILVFTPRNTEQLSRFLNFASKKKIKIAPRGRGTWALGGALLTKGGVVLELASFEKRIEVDPVKQLVTVSASVDFQEAEEALSGHGLTLMARPSNKYGVIGGFLSVGEPFKGGLGLNAIASGHIVNSVEAIRVMTSDGQEKRLGRDSKDFRFFFGTNGRHGIITEITLKARPKPTGHYTTALHFTSCESAFAFLNSFKSDLKSGLLAVCPIHVEFYGKTYLDQTGKLKPKDELRSQGVTVNLVSPEGSRRNPAAKDTVLFVFYDEQDQRGFNAYVTQRNGSSMASQAEADEIWNERFSPMKLRKKGDLLTAEVILPLDKVAAYLEEVTHLARRLGIEILPVAYVLNSAEALVLPQYLTDSRRLFQYLRHFTLAPILARRAIKRFDGRPYGFGLWFAGLARCALGSQVVKELQEAKARLDPANILNRGKLTEINSRLGNILGRLLLHERVIDLIDLVVSTQARFFSTRDSDDTASATKLDPYVREKGDALHRCIKCSACMICPLAQIWERSGDPKLMKDAIYITPRFKLEYMQQHIYEGRKMTQEDVDRFVLCFRCGVAERETVCPISDMLLEVDDSGSSPCQKKLPTYDDFEEQLREEGYDVDGAVLRYMDILKTHPGVASGMKDVLGNYRVPKDGPLTTLQPKTDFAVYKVEVDQDRCINCGKCGDEHTTSQRGFWDPRHPRNMVSLDDLLRDLDGKIPKLWFNDAGGAIPQSLKDQGRSNGEYVYFDLPSLADGGHQHCNGCMYCVIECPVDAIRIGINDYYVDLAGKDFTRDDIRRVNEEARTGGVPTSGTGSTGLFGGKGFDRYMFDFSVIVRPTRDGIREAIDIGVNLGRKPLFHLFENSPDSEVPRLKTHFPSLDLAVPILLELPRLPNRAHIKDLLNVFVQCAQAEGTLAIISLLQFIENFREISRFTENIALRLMPEEVPALKAWIGKEEIGSQALQALTDVPLVEIVYYPEQDGSTAALGPESELEQLFSRKLIISNLVNCPTGSDPREVADQVEGLAESGAQIIHLKTQFNPEKGYYESADILPVCYERLLTKSLHTQVSLISNGIKSPADLGISIMLGASATVIDRVALLALDHEFCTLENRGEALPEIQLEEGLRRLQNLFQAWKKQISEVLGAVGVRDIRRMVGETGRLIDLRVREDKMRAIVEDRKLLTAAKNANQEKITQDGDLARQASWRFSDLSDLIKPVVPPNVNLLGDRGESLESMLAARGDRRWTADLLRATWMMASGQAPSHKVPQTGEDFGGGSFDRMKFAPVAFCGRQTSLERAVEEIDQGIRAGDEAVLSALDNISISAGVINKHRRADSPPIVSHFPIDAADMSLGSIGWKLTLARYLAGTVLKRFTGTGEGGFPLEKSERLERFFPGLSSQECHWLAKQMERWVATQAATGYFGVTEDTIARARKLVLKFAQGAKPGLGGHILGAKVTSQVEDLRGVIAGISVFSPFPFHDVYSIEDVTKMLEWLRTINPDATITVKISTPVDVYHVALGLVTGGADEIQIDATAGGTGAAPDIARNRIAMPLEYGLSDVHKFLVEQGERNKVTLVASGGIRSAYDMAKAIVLGADTVILGTQEVVAQQCNRCGNCEAPGGCQKGITTTVEQLEEQKEILLNAQWLINTQVSIVQHLTKMMHAWGIDDIRDLRGRTDLIAEWGWQGSRPTETSANGESQSAGKSQVAVEGWVRKQEERDQLDACGVVSFACTKTVPVESIQTACQRMHNRGNGRGGGILGLGGIFSEAVKDRYALQVIVLTPEVDRARKIREVARKHLMDFEVFDRSAKRFEAGELRDDHVESFRNPRRQVGGKDVTVEQAGLNADPGDMYRFFVRARKKALLRFAGEVLDTCRITEEEAHVLNNGNPTRFLQHVNIAGKWIDYYVKYFELLTDDYLRSVDPNTEFWLEPEYRDLWRDLEDEFVYRHAFEINQEYYIEPQNRSDNPEAFVASMMKDGGIWKLVGFAEQAADYWLLEDAQYVSVSKVARAVNESLDNEAKSRAYRLPETEFNSVIRRFQETGELDRQASEAIPETKWHVGEDQLEIEIGPAAGQSISAIVPRQGGQAVVVFKVGAHIWIGHQRYPTVFSPYSGGSHPFYGRVNEALIHNGDFANYVAMVRFWDQFGGAPQFKTDTEMAAKAYAILKQMGYPQSHVFEAIAPTTGIDLQRLKETDPVLASDFETIQKTQIAGSPDGPWFFIIAEQDPVSRDLRIIGLTDTSVLRPSVYAWQHSTDDRWASIGLVGSEEQACRSVLDALYEQGILATKEPDNIRTVRGGSVEQEKPDDVRGGGAIIYNLERNDDAGYKLMISDKFGNSIPAEPGQHGDLNSELNFNSAEVRAISAQVFDGNGHLTFRKPESIHQFVSENLEDWDFNTFRWLVESLGNSTKTDAQLKLVLESLTLIKDRMPSLDTGRGEQAKKRASLTQIVTDALDKIFDRVPLIHEGAQSRNYFRVTLGTQDRVSVCEDRLAVLVVDATGFEPEGHHSLARRLIGAYQKGWRKFILYKTTGQRYFGVGFGPNSHDMEMHVYGSPGQDIGNSMMGGTVHVHADAQSDMAKIIHSGRVVIHGLAGNTGVYGAKGGEIYVRDSVGTRWVINSVSSPIGPGLKVVIVGSAMEYLAESLMGGMVLMLGLEWDGRGILRRKYLPFPGNSILAGASAGKVIIYDPDDRIMTQQFEGSVDIGFLSRDWIAVYKNIENLVANAFSDSEWKKYVRRWRDLSKIALQSDDWLLPGKQKGLDSLAEVLSHMTESKSDYQKTRADAESLRTIIEQRFTGKEWRTLVRQLGQVVDTVSWSEGIEVLERLMDWKEVTELLARTDEFFHLGLECKEGKMYLPIGGEKTELKREDFKVLRPLTQQEKSKKSEPELQVIGEAELLEEACRS